jgi:hypothetical protein
MSDLQHDLRMFTGTDQWFRHPFNSNLLYTDGVKFFAEHCGNGAYWFLDIIATELADLQETEDFLTIDLVVKAEEAQADIIVGDGNGGRALHQAHRLHRRARWHLEVLPCQQRHVVAQRVLSHDTTAQPRNRLGVASQLELATF